MIRDDSRDGQVSAEFPAWQLHSQQLFYLSFNTNDEMTWERYNLHTNVLVFLGDQATNHTQTN